MSLLLIAFKLVDTDFIVNIDTSFVSETSKLCFTQILCCKGMAPGVESDDITGLTFIDHLVFTYGKFCPY